jgi:hypothetical protein|tara:strand:- start:35 stop:1618 length:1584 start_codon:yes stop_codon:yes gene_type:complete
LGLNTRIFVYISHAMTTAAAHQDALPSELKVELWKRIDRRLRNGEVLITNEQFYKIMARDFSRLIGVTPDHATKVHLLEMIMQVNDKHPETYLSTGIKNAVDAFFKSTGDNADEAREMIVRMVKEGRTAMWLEGMGIEVDARTLTGRVEQAIIRITEGQKLRAPPPRRENRKRRSRRGVPMIGVSQTSVEPSADEAADPSVYEPAPTEEEQAQRIAEEKARTEELAGEELQRAPRNLGSYMQQKLLSEEEVTDLKKLYGIDKRLADGEIDETEANRLRSEISDVVREKLQSRLREAVDNSVHYINVFEALRRIPADRDNALALLIRHKNQVTADDPEVNLSIVTRTLDEDEELLDELGTLMERKDHEMRMMAANMPPYRHVYTPDQAIGKFSVQDAFVDELRELSRDDLSERLNSEDTDERIKTAADIKCMVALLTTLLKTTTPFHKEVRRLRIVLRMKRLFNGSVDERDGRNRVQQFLKRRLHNLYPDLTKEERGEIEALGQNIMEGRGSGDDEEGGDKAKRVYRV